MSQEGTIDILGTFPQIPTDFIGNSGSAIPIANTLNILGSTQAAGSSPLITTASGNTVTIVAQRTQAIAASDSTKVGFAAFDSSLFTVDANGFVGLTAAAVGVQSVFGTLNRITSTGGQNPVIDIAATYVGQTSITTLGTLTTGTWNATTIGTIYGGTGLTSYTTGDSLYASAANVLSKLAIGTSNQVLTVIAGIPSWQTPAAGGVTSVSGTLNRVTSTGGATPVIDIASTYAGQTSITTLGTVTTGTWNGTAIGPTFGGTGQTTYATGDILYASAVNTLSKLAAGSNTQVLTLAAGIPSWATPTTGTVTSVSGTTNRITSTGGATPVIDISASYVGQSSITTLGTITTGVWNGSVIPLAFGGTNANLTASNGGIFYSTATAGAILAGTATAGQMLRSGATGAPTWSTATFPATAGTSGNVLTSDGTNWTSAAPSAGGVTFSSASGTFTNAQIKAMKASPQLLVAAPGAGKVIQVLNWTCKMIYGGSNIFTAAGGIILTVTYGSGTSTQIGTFISNTDIVAAATSITINPAAGRSGDGNAAFDNVAIYCSNIGASEITGNAANNNTMSWTMVYRTVTT